MEEHRRLGVGLTPMETRREAVLHVADRAEELGYDSFSIAEGWGHDAGALLAEVATRTERIGIATGVLNVWGRSAASVAMLAASLDEISGGRFTLGLGSGSPPLAEGLHDVPFRAPVARLETMTRQVRNLLRGGRAEQTTSTSTRPLRLAVTPEHAVPMHLAALGPRATRAAGALADGWIPFLLPRSGLGDARTLLEEGAAGREDGAVPGVNPCIPAAVSSDAATADGVAAWWITFYLGSMGPVYRDTLSRMGHGAAVEAVLAANPTPKTQELPAAATGLVDELLLHGGPEEARAALDRWYEAGAEMPGVVLPPGRPLGELDEMLEALSPARVSPAPISRGPG